VMVVWSAFTISGPVLGCSSLGSLGSGVSTNATFLFDETNVGTGFTVTQKAVCLLPVTKTLSWKIVVMKALCVPPVLNTCHSAIVLRKDTFLLTVAKKAILGGSCGICIQNASFLFVAIF